MKYVIKQNTLLFQEAQKKKLEDLEKAKQLQKQAQNDEQKRIEKEAQEKLKREEEERIEQVQHIYQESKTLATLNLKDQTVLDPSVAQPRCMGVPDHTACMAF